MFNLKKKIELTLFIKKLLVVIILFSVGCKRTNKNAPKKDTTKDTQLSIEILNYPVSVNEPIKALAKLHNSELQKYDSQIFVVLERDENEPLKEDLSNEYDIDMDFYANMAVDSLNQKWIKSDNKKYTAVFGKEFGTKGKHRLRGYVLDYYGFDILDSILPEKSKKYFFNIEIEISEGK